MIYDSHKDKYLEYMALIKNKCLEKYMDTYFIDGCANSVVSDLGIEFELNMRVDNFLKECGGS